MYKQKDHAGFFLVGELRDYSLVAVRMLLIEMTCGDRL